MMLIRRLLSQSGMDQQQEHPSLAKRLVALPAQLFLGFAQHLRAEERAGPRGQQRVAFLLPVKCSHLSDDGGHCRHKRLDLLSLLFGSDIHLHQHPIHRIEKGIELGSVLENCQ